MTNLQAWENPGVRDIRGLNRARPSPAERGLTDPRNDPSGQQAASRMRPLMLVGDIRGLSPPRMEVGTKRNENGQILDGHWVGTRHLDFRKARGFPDAARSAVVKLGFTEARDAEVRLVDSNQEFLRQVKSNSDRQIIYLGHALGPGGLEPGGLLTAPVPEESLRRAFSPTSPRPIFVGCFSAEVPLMKSGEWRGAIGLSKFLRWKDTEARVSSAGMNKRTPAISDITVDSIDLTTSRE